MAAEEVKFVEVQVEWAWLSFAGIATLLILFFAVVFGLLLAGRRRRRSRAAEEALRDPAAHAPDAWSEAGRRARAYPPPDEDRSPPDPNGG